MKNPVSLISKINLLLLTSLVLIVVVLLPYTQQASAKKVLQGELDVPRKAVDFTQSGESQWINSKPLSLSDLKGKVVLVDFWTFECWNCYRSFPWLNALQKKYQKQGLEIIGVHTPEFEHEKDRNAVRAKMLSFGLDHPVMLDNDMIYWRAMQNRYWPAFYLIDKKGQIRYLYVGETHENTPKATAIAESVEVLLKE